MATPLIQSQREGGRERGLQFLKGNEEKKCMVKKEREGKITSRIGRVVHPRRGLP